LACRGENNNRDPSDHAPGSVPIFFRKMQHFPKTLCAADHWQSLGRHDIVIMDGAASVPSTDRGRSIIPADAGISIRLEYSSFLETESLMYHGDRLARWDNYGKSWIIFPVLSPLFQPAYSLKLGEALISWIVRRVRPEDDNNSDSERYMMIFKWGFGGRPQASYGLWSLPFGDRTEIQEYLDCDNQEPYSMYPVAARTSVPGSFIKLKVAVARGSTNNRIFRIDLHRVEELDDPAPDDRMLPVLFEEEPVGC
jgi:hypothetical protein